MLQNFFKNKNISKKLKLILKNAIIDQTLTYASETSTLTKRDRKQLNIFERKVYRRILGPIYDNEKENWRILTNKEISAIVKKTHYNRDNKVTQITLVWTCTENGRNKIPKRVLYMNLESTRPRGRPRNRWQHEVKEDERIVGGEEWQEKVYNREEWKKLLRTARNSAHANRMNEYIYIYIYSS
jgi:hypothetical protein